LRGWELYSGGDLDGRWAVFLGRRCSPVIVQRLDVVILMVVFKRHVWVTTWHELFVL
jgi:hypothetical protein